MKHVDFNFKHLKKIRDIVWKNHELKDGPEILILLDLASYVIKNGLGLSENELKKEMDEFIAVGANNLGMMLTIEHRDKLAKKIHVKQKGKSKCRESEVYSCKQNSY